jgi:hypothetical protein
MLDPGLETALEVAKIVGIFGGGAVLLIRMGRMAGQFEQIGKQQAQEITEIKREMKIMSDTVTTVAVQKNEISNIHEDITRLYKWYDELRHGKGYVEKSE